MADIEVKRIPRIDVAKAGSLVGTRPRINLIEGSNVTLTVTDDSAGNEVDVTIAASGSATPSDFQPAIVTNKYYFSPLQDQLSIEALQANTLLAFPIWFSSTETWTRIGIFIDTASGSATEKARLGLYTSASNLPDTLLVDSGEIGLNSTGAVEATISQSLTANTLYWLVINTNDPGTLTLVYTATTKTGFGGWMLGAPSGDFGGPYTPCFYKSSAYGALPATFGTTDGNGTAMPNIWLRKV